jgi:uncharacterized RDD family membrane protein YckC
MSPAQRRKQYSQAYGDVTHATPNVYEVAGLRRRAMAYFVDGLFLLIIYRVALVFLDSLWLEMSPYVISPIISVCYYGFFWEQYIGQTPGKIMMGIRVVRVDGRPITNKTVILRCAGYCVNALTLGLGWLAILFDDKRRGWHDRLTGTMVVKCPSHATTGGKFRSNKMRRHLR